MAKKLTNEVLEKLVMESIEEMGDVNEILGAIKNWAMGGSKPASTPFGRKARPPKSGGASESEAVQLLQLIASDPKVPNNIKSQIADFLEYAPSTPELPASAVQPLKATGTAKLPDVPDESEIPTVKTSTAKGTGFSYSSPRATSGPTKGRMPAPSLTPAKKKVAESKIEALVAEVLAEISDKERRDLEAHYGPDMRGAEASKKQLDKIDAAIKGKKERLKNLKDLKGLRGHYGEDVSGKKQNDKKIAELEKEIKQLEAELGSKKTAKK